MNRALIYLWFTLLKRRLMHFCRNLRRPATAIGFLAVVAMFAVLFCFRRQEWVGRLVETRTLTGAGLVMAFGSVFKGFLQRGLVFELPDIEFVFTSPFTPRQIIFYRLLPDYLFALLQSVGFLVLFWPHLANPLLMGSCLVLFQIACFHAATAAEIFSGTLPVNLHHRLRWMILGAFFFLVALYLRAGWDLRLVPRWMSTPLTQILFYPAVNLSEVANAAALHRLFSDLGADSGRSLDPLWKPALYVVGFTTAALVSLWVLLRQRGEIFEPALVTTGQIAERRTRIERGGQAAPASHHAACSHRLSALPIFRGAGAIIWKNLVVARRSKRQIVWVSAFAFIYTGFTTALVYLYHHYAAKAGVTPPRTETEGFHVAIALFLAALLLFLQRMVPFDFRRDGQHLVGFRNLPFSSLGIACAELTVPTGLCLLLLAPCVLTLLVYARFSLWLTALVVLAYPAVALALNAVWNIHYLLAATKREAGENVSAVGTLLIVALSFLVFYPGAWTALRIGQHMAENSGIQLPLSVGLTVQYSIDLCLVWLLAKLYARFEVGR